MIVITGIGAVACFTNDWYRWQSSEAGPLPLPYKHLLLPPDETDEAADKLPEKQTTSMR